ncbi:MAG: amidohydrolase family protein [Gammaproteobacteria bacterium]
MNMPQKIVPRPWPTDRKIPAQSWRPPADVRMISADDHSLEPMHLWEERLPAKYKDRAPKLWRDDKGIHMEVEGRSLDVPGIRPQISEGCDGFWDREAKLRAMDAEGIEATVLFHGRLQSLNMLQDKELYTACIDVYNDYLAEFCRPNPNRLIGVAVLPTFHNPPASRDYMQKIKALGYKAVQIPSFPRGVRYNSMSMEPMWAAIEESGLPLSFHVGAYIEFVGNGSLGANLTRNLGPYRGLLGQLTFAGVFDRHPNLKVIFTEGGIGWLGQTLADMDKIAEDYYTELDPKLSLAPSAYWHRQCFATFMDDPIGLRIIDFIGEDNVMWSLDYPHAEGVHGYAGEVAKRIYDTLGHERAKKVLGGNAARVWGI